MLAAGRFTHAFVDDVSTTVCGIAVDALHWRELVCELWDDPSPMLRCQTCESLIAADGPG